MVNTAVPFGSNSDRNSFLAQDFDCNTEARCSTCDDLVNVHKWIEHRKECFISKSQRCDLCSSEFNHEVNLKIHKLLKHSPPCQDCIVCNKRFKRESAFRGHVISHCVIDNLVCGQCKDEFETPVEMNRHRRLIHSDNVTVTEALICCYCGEIFSPLDLEAHKKLHHYQSSLQKKIDSAKKKVEENSTKPAIRAHMCSVCQKSFRRPKELERHEAIHSEKRNFKCSFCPMEFRHENVLQSHEKLHKRVNRIHKCRICHHNFNTRFNLDRHVQMTHLRKENDGKRKARMVEDINYKLDHNFRPMQHLADVFPHHTLMDYADRTDNIEIRRDDCSNEWNVTEVGDSEIEHGVDMWTEVSGCDLAQQLFPYRDQQKERLVIIGENSLRCPACIHSMESIEHFMAHYQALGEKDSLHRQSTFTCMFCLEDVLGLNVFSHLESHGIAPITPYQVDTLSNHHISRPHVCPSCQNAFTKKVDLTRHIRTHTGEKPFECQECGDKFRVETTLRRHEKIHSDTDDTHECSLCGKGLLSRNGLRAHMMKHTTPCYLCHETFKGVAERDEHRIRDHSNREVGVRNRSGGIFLPSLPGGLATLTQISRPISSKLLVSTSSSAFQSIISNSKEEAHKKLNVEIHAEDTAKEGIVMKLYRKRANQKSPVASRGYHSSSVSFSIPQLLLSSLQNEGGVLRTQLNRGRVVNMHPSETLSALVYSDGMDMHPVQSQSLQECSSSQIVRSSSFVPVDVNSDNYFMDHCNICDVSFSNKKESESHMSCEDHETATLLTPHSGMEQSKNEMFCKLCGNRFMSMAPLVEHIRREHERDHPKSLAPLNLHTSHLLK